MMGRSRSVESVNKIVIKDHKTQSDSANYDDNNICRIPAVMDKQNIATIKITIAPIIATLASLTTTSSIKKSIKENTNGNNNHCMIIF
jgi:hypothetical protein